MATLSAEQILLLAKSGDSSWFCHFREAVKFRSELGRFIGNMDFPDALSFLEEVYYYQDFVQGYLNEQKKLVPLSSYVEDEILYENPLDALSAFFTSYKSLEFMMLWSVRSAYIGGYCPDYDGFWESFIVNNATVARYFWLREMSVEMPEELASLDFVESMDHNAGFCDVVCQGYSFLFCDVELTEDGGMTGRILNTLLLGIEKIEEYQSQIDEIWLDRMSCTDCYGGEVAPYYVEDEY